VPALVRLQGGLPVGARSEVHDRAAARARAATRDEGDDAGRWSLNDTERQFHELFSLYVPILVAALVILYAVVLYALVRFRRRDGAPGSRRSEAKLGESVYAILLASIAVVLVAATFVIESRIDPVAARPALRVDVVAFQWQWRFRYPGLGITVTGTRDTPPTLVVPANETIGFTATSRDVIHSFWVPETRFKRDAFPDRNTRFDLVFEPGDHVGHCAEFCGLRHADMDFHVRAVPRGEFQRWASARRGGGPG
jgi:cytochrome c oxidase subunit 2